MYGEISIHVPAWGTTKIYCNYGCLSAISIHVPAWGTTDGNVISGYPDEFQSTFPRGERQNLSRNIFLKEYFNPRSRVGNDWATWTQQARNKNFNPRSRVGNDTVQWNLELDCRISIHVPAWGTTCSGKGKSRSNKISIHVPAWGTTIMISETSYMCVFQSTFPRGERLPEIYSS